MRLIIDFIKDLLIGLFQLLAIMVITLVGINIFIEYVIPFVVKYFSENIF